MRCLKCKKEIADNLLICSFCNTKVRTVCPICGTKNPINAEFCEGCGLQLLKYCESCGSVNRPDADKCRKCGMEFEKDSALVNILDLEKQEKVTSSDNLIDSTLNCNVDEDSPLILDEISEY